MKMLQIRARVSLRKILLKVQKRGAVCRRVPFRLRRTTRLAVMKQTLSFIFLASLIPNIAGSSHEISEDVVDVDSRVRVERNYGGGGGPLAAKGLPASISPKVGPPPKDIVVSSPCSPANGKCGFNMRPQQRLTELMFSVTKLLGLITCDEIMDCERECNKRDCNYITLSGSNPYQAHLYKMQDSAIQNTRRYSAAEGYDSLYKTCPSSSLKRKGRSALNNAIPPSAPSSGPTTSKVPSKQQSGSSEKPAGGASTARSGSTKTTGSPRTHATRTHSNHSSTQSNHSSHNDSGSHERSNSSRDHGCSNRSNSSREHGSNRSNSSHDNGCRDRSNSSGEHGCGNRSSPDHGNSSRDHGCDDRSNTSRGSNESNSSEELLDNSTISSSNSSSNNSFYNTYSQNFSPEYTNDEERETRARQFEANVHWMDERNAQLKNPDDAPCGLNGFASENRETFAKDYGGATVHEKEDVADAVRLPSRYISKLKLKKQLDWRKHDVISPIRFQGKCGACYAFALADLIASHNAIDRKAKNKGSKTNSKKVEPLSPQFFIDCAPPGAAEGCKGGRPIKVLEHLASDKTQGGVPLEVCQKYKGQASGNCPTDVPCCQRRTIQKGKMLDVSGPHEKEFMAAMLNAGPVLAIVNINEVWQFNNGSGIIKSHQCNPDERNHAVVIVGFNYVGNTSFYIVKNSWSPSWGDKGYAKLEAGKNACGVAKNVITICVNNCDVAMKNDKALLARNNAPE